MYYFRLNILSKIIYNRHTEGHVCNKGIFSIQVFHNNTVMEKTVLVLYSLCTCNHITRHSKISDWRYASLVSAVLKEPEHLPCILAGWGLLIRKPAFIMLHHYKMHTAQYRRICRSLRVWKIINIVMTAVEDSCWRHFQEKIPYSLVIMTLWKISHLILVCLSFFFSLINCIRDYSLQTYVPVQDAIHAKKLFQA